MPLESRCMPSVSNSDYNTFPNTDGLKTAFKCVFWSRTYISVVASCLLLRYTTAALYRSFQRLFHFFKVVPVVVKILSISVAVLSVQSRQCTCKRYLLALSHALKVASMYPPIPETLRPCACICHAGTV